MWPNKMRFFFRALIPTIFLSSCSQFFGDKAELPQRRFFDFRAEPLRLSSGLTERPYPAQVQVKSFEVQRAYNRNEIIFRRDQYELHKDALHSWITRPGDLFTDAIQQYLEAAELFTYIGGDQDFYERRPDYILSGTVNALERFDSGDIWAAHLATSMKLIRQQDALVIWQKDFDQERQVYFPEMKHTVAAFSQLLNAQMEICIREIDFIFFNINRGKIETQQLLNSMIDSVETDQNINRISKDIEIKLDYELLPGKIAK